MDTPHASADTMARIRAALEQRIAPTEIRIEDESARHIGHAGAREGGHFRVRVVSECFRGLTRVARHRMVYQAVAELMGSGIHALAVDARAPEEADRK
ncbi:MAG TPA: BolA family protein [Steroidobacteraceae bacterium]|jgi:BolA family transcriptional regulator, general stress-responsive regulator|nr:BolA family protein [Steroidobacteraceae bacterium]